jgi:hypothetical protein
MVIPPLCQFARGQNGKAGKVTVLWPLFQYSRGDRSKLYFFPLWGRKAGGKDRMWFALWPIVDCRQTARSEYRCDRFQVAPLYYDERRRSWAGEGTVEAAPYSRNIRVWPLLRYKRDRDALSFRMVELWFGADVGGAERNLAPLWTLYSHQRDGERVEDELLWGTVRYRRGGDFGREISVFPLFRYARDREGHTREWSVLGGLAAKSRSSLQSRFRLLYFFTSTRNTDPGQEEQNDNP